MLSTKGPFSGKMGSLGFTRGSSCGFPSRFPFVLLGDVLWKVKMP